MGEREPGREREAEQPPRGAPDPIPDPISDPIPGGSGLGNARRIVCWICGAAILERHCKIVCQNCGFTRDCSDP
jgi:hypothetical protein